MNAETCRLDFLREGSVTGMERQEIATPKSNAPNTPETADLTHTAEPSHIDGLSGPQLLLLWGRVMGCKPPPHLSVSFMRLALSYESQCAEYGGLSKKARKELAAARPTGKGSSVSNKRPKASTGSQIIREWNGVVHKVDVVDGGYLYQEKSYRSLSAIAREITARDGPVPASLA